MLVSHEHYDHNAVEIVSGRSSKVFRSFAGRSRVGSVLIEGVRFFHDKSGGALRGESIAYSIEAGGLRVVHLGDLGHDPGERLSFMRGADVLMIPVGGTSTINYSEALAIVERAKPKIVIPMHYWLPGSTLPLDPVDPFIRGSLFPVARVEGRSIVIKREELTERTVVLHLP